MLFDPIEMEDDEIWPALVLYFCTQDGIKCLRVQTQSLEAMLGARPLISRVYRML